MMSLSHEHDSAMPFIDAVGNAITLGSSLILGIVLLLPGPPATKGRP